MELDLALLFAQSGSNDGFGDDFNWPMAVFLVGTTAAIALAATVVVWQAFATWRSRMSIAREEAYRTLSQDLARFQSRIADSMERTHSELTEIRQRTAELERMLKDVGSQTFRSHQPAGAYTGA